MEEQIDFEQEAMEGPEGNLLAARMAPAPTSLPKPLHSGSLQLQRRISSLNLSLVKVVLVVFTREGSRARAR